MAGGKVPMVTVSPAKHPDMLKAPQRKGFKRRWVKDLEEQVLRLKEEEGYEVVEKDGEPVRRREYILMEIPLELYAVKQRAKVERVLASRRRAAVRREASAEAENVAQKFGDKAGIIGSVEIEGHGTDTPRPINVE